MDIVNLFAAFSSALRRRDSNIGLILYAVVVLVWEFRSVISINFR